MDLKVKVTLIPIPCPITFILIGREEDAKGQHSQYLYISIFMLEISLPTSLSGKKDLFPQLLQVSPADSLQLPAFFQKCHRGGELLGPRSRFLPEPAAYPT